MKDERHRTWLKLFLKKHFDTLQPFILCGVLGIGSYISDFKAGLVIAIALLFFLVSEIFVNSGYFWDD